MNILSIGNSFSIDAQRYLHRIARSAGVELTTCNLYIGGCPLELHYRNMLTDEKKYALGINGEDSWFYVSLSEALANRKWDVITFQQASHESPFAETYDPYLEELAEYVRTFQPKAKFAFHQTWAYEANSERLNMVGGMTAAEMLEGIKKAAAKAAKTIDADMLIPCGEVMRALSEAGIEKVHRDTFHASYGLGRYALGLCWYKVLTGNSLEEVTFTDTDEPMTAEEIAIAKQCVNRLVK